MDIYKRIVYSRHGGTLNSRRAVSSLVKLVEGEERRETPDPPQGVLIQNWGGNEASCTVTYMVAKATANDRLDGLKSIVNGTLQWSDSLQLTSPVDDGIFCGRGSLAVKVTGLWLACHELEPGTAEDPPCGGIRYTLNMSRFK
ncbi:hypothetical protein TNCV_132491 [Trichonephila clavipes]|nr:hypothetical protein TNCV_132491 [Trichonephila clavipes]